MIIMKKLFRLKDILVHHSQKHEESVCPGIPSSLAEKIT